ncbi:hypothetical protein MASR1M8_19140 [Thermomonas brevis]
METGVPDGARHISTLYQRERESEDAFIYRIGGELRAFTARTGFEGCGNICASADRRLGILLFTDASQLACRDRGGCPLGMSPVGNSIHSHPASAPIRYNQNDVASINGRSSRKAEVGQAQVIYNGGRFSKLDYKHGPGYLVYGDALLHQRGKGTQRQVGWIPPLAAAPQAPQPAGCADGVGAREAR